MALKAILDSLDGLDEAVQKEYTEKDGKFYLSVEAVDGFSLEDVSGLKSTLGKTKRALEEATTKVTGFDGLDPVKVKADLAKLEELSGLDPEKEADKIAEVKIKAANVQLLEKHATEVAAKDTSMGVLKTQLEKVLIVAEATKAISEQKGSIDLLMPHVLASAKLKPLDNGEYAVEVMDSAGNPRIGDAKGTPMNIPQLVEEMKSSDAFGVAFDGSGQSGGGSNSNSGQQQHGTKKVAWGDQQAMGNSLEDIAKGEVLVQ